MQKTIQSQISGVALALAVCLACSAGCAKIGEPQPPEVHVPKAAADLAAHQLADVIQMKVTKPTVNTDGSALTTLASIDLFRITEDTHKDAQASALPDEELVRRGERIRSIPVSRLTEYLRGEFIVLQDTLDFPDRSSIYSHTYRYAVIFVNHKNQAAGFSNQVLITPVPIPLPPSEISATVEEKVIKLKWHEPSENADGSKPPRIAGYKIYRAEGSGEFRPIHADITKGSLFEDRDFQFDASYRYTIGTVGSAQNPYAESRPSEALAVAPRDTFAPAPPENFQAIHQEGSLILLWTPSSSVDVAGYRIYRQDKASGARTPLQKELITVLNYRDSPQDGQYSYAILTVDTHGNESSLVQAEVELRRQP
jgi:hypothetical protein